MYVCRHVQNSGREDWHRAVFRGGLHTFRPQGNSETRWKLGPSHQKNTRVTGPYSHTLHVVSGAREAQVRSSSPGGHDAAGTVALPQVQSCPFEVLFKANMHHINGGKKPSVVCIHKYLLYSYPFFFFPISFNGEDRLLDVPSTNAAGWNAAAGCVLWSTPRDSSGGPGTQNA